MLVDIDVFQHDSGLGLIYSKYVGSYNYQENGYAFSQNSSFSIKVNDQKNID